MSDTAISVLIAPLSASLLSSRGPGQVMSLWASTCPCKHHREGVHGSSNMLAPVQVAVWAIPGYAVLPAVTEWVVEGGHTLVYSRVASVGLPHFLGFFALYMACVELCVYWTHRILHEHRPSYR